MALGEPGYPITVSNVLDHWLAWDAALFHYFNALPHPDWLTVAMAAISLMSRGAALWVALALVVVAISRSDWAGVWRVALTLAITATLVSTVIKPTISRSRPYLAHRTVETVSAPPTTSSFPSGHAATSAAGAFALSRLWPSAAVPLWSTALIVGVSRVYLGFHYPLDVIAGLIVGLICAYFVTGGMVYRTVTSATAGVTRGWPRRHWARHSR